jgi:hypothetical protein
MLATPGFSQSRLTIPRKCVIASRVLGGKAIPKRARRLLRRANYALLATTPDFVKIVVATPISLCKTEHLC